MTEIIVRKGYEHFNRELNMQIHSKRQYNDELKRRGLCMQEEGDDRAVRAIRDARKDYKIDQDTERFLSEVKDTVSKDGKVQLGSKALDFMKKKGVHFNRPEDKGLKGGWE